jgi:hypothetical protein
MNRHLNLGCAPIYKHVPVLKRKNYECDDNGYFKWLPTTEKINFGCVCVTENNWYPFI